MNRVRIQRWPMVLAMLAVLLLGMNGCAGGSRASSWAGLTVAEGKLYAADITQVTVLEAENSEEVWTYPRNPEDNNQGSFYATPTVGDERVFVTSQIQTSGFISQRENTVWALDAETGQELWRFEGASGQYVEGGALSDGIFVIGNDDGNVYALDAEDGSLKWTFETGDRVWATPLIESNVVYIGSMDRHLYALNLENGQKRWDFQTQGAFAGTPALKDNTLYIGAFNDVLYAINAETGTELWRFDDSEDWFWGSPVIHSDTVYATNVVGNVYALDAESGEEKWQQALETPVRAGPALSEDGSKLFVSAENGVLYALDTTDGFEMWIDESEGRALARPIVSNSTVYKALIYGPQRIRALHTDNGREVWAYPPVEEE